MITSRHRFHGYGSLKYVYTHGQTTRGPLFAVKTIVNHRRRSYRLAVVVSRKVNKSAVVRNRIRRRIYEAVRQYEGAIGQPLDIVITVFHDTVVDLPAKQLNSQIKRQLIASSVLSPTKPVD